VNSKRYQTLCILICIRAEGNITGSRRDLLLIVCIHLTVCSKFDVAQTFGSGFIAIKEEVWEAATFGKLCALLDAVPCSLSEPWFCDPTIAHL